MAKSRAKQTCLSCPHLEKCWGAFTNSGNPISKQNIIININICRLQLGIERDKAAMNLIQLYKPGMMRLINNAKQSGNDPNMDPQQLFHEMSSTMIELLSYDYKIGDRGRATPYLFDPQQGFITKWIMWIFSKNRRFYAHHEMFNITDERDDDDTRSWDSAMAGESSQWHSSNLTSVYHNHEHAYADKEAGDDASELSRQILAVIDDGITLNSNEYRVMKFCLSNGNETNASRHIDGLHIYLARLMGVSRPRITRLYKRARQKIMLRYQELLNEE